MARGRIVPFRCEECGRSEEHTSELQSRLHLVCRLLLEKKKVSEILRKERGSQGVGPHATTTRTGGVCVREGDVPAPIGDAGGSRCGSCLFFYWRGRPRRCTLFPSPRSSH